MGAQKGENSKSRQSQEQALDIVRAGADAKKAISGAVHSREVSRSARLRTKLDSIAAQCRSCPPPTASAATKILEELLDDVMSYSEAQMGNLHLLDKRTGALRIRVHRGFRSPFIKFFEAVDHGEAACGAALQKGKPVVIEDVKESPVHSAAARRVMIEAGAMAVQSVPLVSPKGAPIGVVSVHYSEPGIPSVRLEAVGSLSSKIAEIVALCA